ncbi:hypothetical protein C3B79_3471 [Aeromonas hydrophila]|nr:hypothetical protein C3B79_3471 [Aeromonas hydrophila]
MHHALSQARYLKHSGHLPDSKEDTINTSLGKDQIRLNQAV